MYYLFQVVSDIHIEREYPNVPKWDKIINKRSENIILAGDIGHLELFEQYNLFIYDICKNFTNVILVPGNHEFYSEKYEFETLYKLLLQLKKNYTNLTILDDNYIDLNYNIRIYGTTLWCNNIPYSEMKKNIPIIENNEKIRNDWLIKKSNECINNLDKIIKKTQEDDKRLVVISHYSPTINNLNPRNYICELRYYYFTNLEHLFQKNLVYTWIYGHTHYNKDYYSKENTRILSNQYRAKNYNKNKLIKINSKNN